MISPSNATAVAVEVIQVSSNRAMNEFVSNVPGMNKVVGVAAACSVSGLITSSEGFVAKALADSNSAKTKWKNVFS